VWGKIDRNSVFLGRNPYIADRLCITVSYMSFNRFWKNSNFHSKSVVVRLRFYRKSPAWGKNWSKHSLSWSWPPYCQSVIHNGLIYEFLQILKKLKFFLKIRSWLAYGFTENRQFGTKTDQNSLFPVRGCPYCRSVIHNGPVYEFLWV
jgi:hypothetical protein